MATHSNILAWRIPIGKSLVGYSPWGCLELDMTETLYSLGSFTLLDPTFPEITPSHH